MVTIEIEDYHCPSWNILYTGVHWVTRKKMVDEIHQMVYFKCRAQKIPLQTQPVKLEFELSYKKRLRHDIDNAFLKPFVDGLVKAGVLTDDSSQYVNEISIKTAIGQPKDKIIIKII